ncbi:MAG: AI-2E family transporter [Acidobacteriota bacterium]
MPETKTAPSTTTHITTVSGRIIAAAIVIACINYASSVVITLICAILIAFVLEPCVHLLERIRVPRWLGALLMLVLSIGLVYLVIYGIYDRVIAFIQEFPTYAQPLKHLFANFEAMVKNIERLASGVVPASSAQQSNLPTIRLQQESHWGQYLVRGIGSVYTFTVTVMFVPFLVFFMLTAKNHIWRATLNLFSDDHREQAETVIVKIGDMIRRYIFGNMLVALMAAALITPVFSLMQLHFALLIGPITAFLSMIPYLGVALAIAPPLMMALGQYATATPFILIAITVMVVHFLAINVLTPKFVGHQVSLNALTVTIAMMFWGWLWGAVGLILAVPLTAALKAICDNVERLKPWGAWMGEG